LLLAYLHLAE